MYRRRDPKSHPEQGDVLVRVPRPTFSLVDSKVDDPAAEITDSAVSEVAFDLTDAIILTQSCDLIRGDTVLLAPLVEWTKASSPRALATKLDPVGQFYLPDLPALALPKRIAKMSDVFTIPREELVQYSGRHRLIQVGLSPKALEYLQYKIGVVFGRLARDEADWPSLDDIDKLISDLDKKIPSARGDLLELLTSEKAALVADRERVKTFVDNF